MKILGRDFMEWFDQWDVDAGAYYWDTFDWLTEGAVDPLHQDDGTWKLDPDTLYDLDDLGEIRPDEGNEIVDTEKVIGTWLARRGLVAVPVRVPKGGRREFLSSARHLKVRDLKVAGKGAEVSGADFRDWYDHGMQDGLHLEENDVAVESDDGRWMLDPEATYRIEELGYLVRESGSVDAPDLSVVVRSYLRGRAYDVIVVLVDPARSDELVQLSEDAFPGSGPRP